MEFRRIIEKRKSVRSFSGKPVARDTLDYILSAGSLAPTSRNRRPCTFHLIEDKETLWKLSCAKQAGAAFAADAAAAVVVAADSEKADTWIEDSSIALTYMMLAAEEQELGCCWVQLHLRFSADGRDAQAYAREILGLPQNFRIVGFLALGYRKEEE